MKSGKPDTRSYRGFSMDDFIRGMDSPWKKRITPEIARICLSLRPGAKSIIDIGGAPGTIAREFARRGLRTVIYDLAISNRVMKRELSGLKNITVLDGDATKSLPGGRFDIAFLGNLCHGQSPRDNERIIKMCREILNDRGMIVIFDNLRGEDEGAATLALHMITQSPHGNVYTRRQYLSWLKTAGFKKCSVKKLSDPAWSLVVGYR
jgi:precorrin-6B methylase 2